MTRRWCLGLLGLVLLSIGAVSLGPALFGSNFRAVVEGRVYRSAQLAPEELEARIERHGIRSIVNLRGPKEDREWYREETAVAGRHDVVLTSLDLVPQRLPSRPAVVALIDSLERLPEPILLHCAAGADRTGFASVVAKMASGGATFDEARKELSFRYGHVPFGRSSEIGRIFDLYASYLRESNGKDRWPTFERWARQIYVPYVYAARLEAEGLPSEVEAGERMDVRIRVTNTSPGAWVFTSEKERGIKLGVRLRRHREAWLDYDRHGHFDRVVRPGEEVELEASIWAPRDAGTYEIKLDLVDEHVAWFEDQGSEPVVRELVVSEDPIR